MIETRLSSVWQDEVRDGLREAARNEVVRRLWSRDHTLWKGEDLEISDRLGWLEAPASAAAALVRWRKLADRVRAEGKERVVLLGMGGSSLAPEVFSRVFGPARGWPRLEVLDSTVPRAVIDTREALIPEKTLFIVSSKSGTTLETSSLHEYFYGWMAERIGTHRAGRNFLAITDAETPLQEAAVRQNFRDVEEGIPDIGGRYSALSAFGLLPAAILGLDIESLVRDAGRMALLCRDGATGDNPGLILGTALGRLAARGCDKLMLLLPRALESFGGWLEQLIAESTGKSGRGILPVLGEKPEPPGLEADDRLWVVFRLKGDISLQDSLNGLQAAQKPCLVIDLESPPDLGGQFFLWEVATAVAGWCLGVNPFDQPDVAAAKKNTSRMLEEIDRLGEFPEEEPAVKEKDLALFGDTSGASAAGAIRRFMAQGRPGDYVSLQAFLAPHPETDGALAKMAGTIRTWTGLPVTIGYGPRFLHSTGQLHKGDAGRGLFLQVSADDPQDVPLPSGLSFGRLKDAQALGDYQALRQAGRRILRLRLGNTSSRGTAELLSRLLG